MDQIKTRARRIDTDEKKLTAQAEIDGKREWIQLVKLTEVPASESYA